MSSQQQPETSPLAAVFPLILGFSSNPDARPLQNLPEGLFVLNPYTFSDLLASIPFEPLFSHLSAKTGPSPASKAAIDALPAVQLTEDTSEDCPICLSDYEVGCEAKEMPCKHRFHPGCIDKWLGANASCPVCRFSLPVESEEEAAENFDGEGRRRRRFGEISITFHFGGAPTRRNNDQGSDVGGTSTPPNTDIPTASGDDGEIPTSESEAAADCN